MLHKYIISLLIYSLFLGIPLSVRAQVQDHEQIRITGAKHFLPYEPVTFQIELLESYYQDNPVISEKRRLTIDSHPSDIKTQKHQPRITISDEKSKLEDFITVNTEEVTYSAALQLPYSEQCKFLIKYYSRPENQVGVWNKPGTRRIDVVYSYNNGKQISASHVITIDDSSKADAIFLEAWPEKHRDMLAIYYPYNFLDKFHKEYDKTGDAVACRNEFRVMHELCQRSQESKYVQMMTGNLLVIATFRPPGFEEKVLKHFDLKSFEIDNVDQRQAEIAAYHPGYLFGLAKYEMRVRENFIRAVYYSELAHKNDPTLSRRGLYGVWKDAKMRVQERSGLIPSIP